MLLCNVVIVDDILMVIVVLHNKCYPITVFELILIHTLTIETEYCINLILFYTV